jgi:hypothetical protein
MIENLSKLPATLFSPFKTLYIGYIVLISLGKITISGFWEFFWVSIIIMIFEIADNHYLRIKLNKWAEK